MKQNQDKLNKLRNDFTLSAKKISEILGISLSSVNDKMCQKKLYYWFKPHEIEKLKIQLIQQAEELKEELGYVTQAQLLDALKRFLETCPCDWDINKEFYASYIKAKQLIEKK